MRIFMNDVPKGPHDEFSSSRKDCCLQLGRPTTQREGNTDFRMEPQMRCSTIIQKRTPLEISANYSSDLDCCSSPVNN